MRFNLSKVLLVPALAIAAAVLATPARAAETVNIPFDFNALGQSYPAGTYSVEQKPAQHIVRLQQVNGKASLNWMVGAGSEAGGNHVLLNFKQDGAKHELRSIQYGRRFTVGAQPFSATSPRRAPAIP
jgi:hypothetical protein